MRTKSTVSIGWVGQVWRHDYSRRSPRYTLRYSIAPSQFLPVNSLDDPLSSSSIRRKMLPIGRLGEVNDAGLTDEGRISFEHIQHQLLIRSNLKMMSK